MKNMVKRIRTGFRHYTQLVAAVLYNCNFKGFVEGRIHKGNTKGICVPGLNCYSCPGAVGACPLGSLQSGLLSSWAGIPFYVIGTLMLFGIMLGRLICSFLCPFGFLQELLYKIPTPKLKKNRVTRLLSKLKYAILLIFVILIPIVRLTPGFCKYICPAGTLEAGIPLVLKNEALRDLIGFMFSWKVFILCATILLCIFCFRGFCRFICPLGALYSLFNPIAFFGFRVDEEKCTHCQACVRSCHMDVKKVGDMECVQCGECRKKCPENAISFRCGPATGKNGKEKNNTSAKENMAE